MTVEDLIPRFASLQPEVRHSELKDIPEAAVEEQEHVYSTPDAEKKEETRISVKKDDNPRNIKVKLTDMNEQLQKEVVEIALYALEHYRIEKDIAQYIKEEMDRRHESSWHCVVGRTFGSFVTHEANRFIYFYIQHIAVMLFKTAF